MMTKSDPTGRDIDSLLHEAGARWRERQVFEAVPIAPRAMVRSESGLQRLVSPALGLVAMLAVGAAVVALAPIQLDGVGSGMPSSGDPPASPPPTSVPTRTLSPADEEAAWLRVVEAVNSDPSSFGLPRIDDSGARVVQYVNEDARAAVEAELTPGLTIRWEKVEYSQSELRRIRSEISDMRLEGVTGVSSGTSRNRVIVYVVPWGSVEKVAEALESYGEAVVVEFSDVDSPVVLPVLPTSSP